MAIVGRNTKNDNCGIDPVEGLDLTEEHPDHFLSNFDPNLLLIHAAPDLTCALGSLGLALYGYAEHNIVETSAAVISMIFFIGKTICKEFTS